MDYYSELLHDTTEPYKILKHNGIEYTSCKNYKHLSRYRRLRQVVHYLDDPSRYITLESQNSYNFDNLEVEYFVVPVNRENRLDLISNDFYNTANYGWVIAYVNNLQDGYTVREGQVLAIPKNISQLFESENILSSIPVTSMNLGTE